MSKPNIKLVESARYTYRMPKDVYRRLPRHRAKPGGCSAGKLYPLPSNPEEYAVCLKCGEHVAQSVLDKYAVMVPRDVPNLKELRIE